jgi:hypothetical protein
VVDDVLAKATAKDPEDRYADCGLFLAELATVLRAHRSSPAPTDARYPPITGLQAGTELEPPTAATYPTTGGGPSGGRSIAVLTATGQRSRRRWIWAVLGGAVVLALAVTGFLVVRAQRPDTRHFAATDEVPVAFDYPADWGPPAQENVKLVVSPHADEFLHLFNQLGAPAAWEQIGGVLRTDRGKAIGMYTTFNQIGFDTASLRQALPSILPQQTDANLSWNDAGLGKSYAFRFGGSFTNPADAATKLSFACYIGQATAPEARSVHMIFFADAASFDSHRDTFDRIAKSAVLRGT